MASNKSRTSRDDGMLHNADVSDQTISQVAKAVAQILRLRQSLQEDIATAQTDEERQSLAAEVESAAARAIDEQGLSITQYNEVITAAQSDPELEERVLLAYRTAA
jgi:hypothetical protein